MFKDFDFGTEIISKYIDFDVNPNLPMNKQVLSLKEDMLQITYKGGLVLDVGWYPEFELDGNFVVVIIKNFDWENPTFKKKCNNVAQLYDCLSECIKYIKSTLENNTHISSNDKVTG